MREDAGRVEQFLPVDRRLRDVQKPEEEELQRLSMIGGQQFAHRMHGVPPSGRRSTRKRAYAREGAIRMPAGQLMNGAQAIASNAPSSSILLCPRERSAV